MAWTIGLIDASGTSEVQSDGRCGSKYTRKYLVLTDSPVFVSEADVAAAVGITRGSPLAADPNAICYSAAIDMGPTMTRPPFQARHATYLFSTDAPLPDSDDDDPTTRRVLWSVGAAIQSTYIIRDRHDKLIVNSAGQPFDGGIPVDVRMGTVTATRNVDAAGYDKSNVMANSGKLNSATYLGGAPGTVQVDITATEAYEGAFHLWKETYTFSYNPKGWQPKPVNAGFFQKDVSNPGKIIRIKNGDLGDSAGTDALAADPVQEPEPLYDEESEIADVTHTEGTVVPYSDRPDGCTFVLVDFFEEMDFDTFGLV